MHHRRLGRAPRSRDGASGYADAVTDRFAALFAAVRGRVLEGDGHSSPSMRRAAALGGPLPDDLAAFTAAVRERAWAITDDDVRRLAAAGHEDDVLFELVVAAAIGRASHARDRALAALDGDPR